VRAYAAPSGVEQVHLRTQGLGPEHKANQEGARGVVACAIKLFRLLHGVHLRCERGVATSDGRRALQRLLHLLVGDVEVLDAVRQGRMLLEECHHRLLRGDGVLRQRADVLGERVEDAREVGHGWRVVLRLRLLLLPVLRLLWLHRRAGRRRVEGREGWPSGQLWLPQLLRMLWLLLLRWYRVPVLIIPDARPSRGSGLGAGLGKALLLGGICVHRAGAGVGIQNRSRGGGGGEMVRQGGRVAPITVVVGI
jgi:hypothetical protein